MTPLILCGYAPIFIVFIGASAMPKPFLKWVGGKHKVIKNIVPHIEKCQGTRFIEPFVGSAAISIQVHEQFDRLLLADYNVDLINLYDLLKNGDVEDFIDLTSQFFGEDTHTSDMYYHLRKEFNNTNDPILRAVLFIYLNRHGYNGMCRYNSSGGFNIPVGRYKTTPMFPKENMLEFSKMLKDNDAELKYCSFEDIFPMVGEGDVVYCDPPYIAINATASFSSYTADGFTGEQHVLLADLAREAQGRGAHVLISNHYLEEIIPDLYRGAELEIFPVQRTISAKASSRKKVDEVLAIFKPQ